jgi:hypothetical protein
MTRSDSIHSEPRSTRRPSEHTLRLVGDSFGRRISGRLTLDTRTADGEADGDVAARGSGVRAGFVCTSPCRRSCRACPCRTDKACAPASRRGPVRDWSTPSRRWVPVRARRCSSWDEAGGTPGPRASRVLRWSGRALGAAPRRGQRWNGSASCAPFSGKPCRTQRSRLWGPFGFAASAELRFRLAAHERAMPAHRRGTMCASRNCEFSATGNRRQAVAGMKEPALFAIVEDTSPSGCTPDRKPNSERRESWKHTKSRRL